MKTFIKFAILVASISVAIAAPQNLKKGVAIKGYDPVAYFTDQGPTKGSSDLTASHDGATYHFSTEANQKAFTKNPNKYAPEYGGYCAYGISVGKLIKVNPKVFFINDGKLYLQYNRSVAKDYASNLKANLATSDQQWVKLSK